MNQLSFQTETGAAKAAVFSCARGTYFFYLNQKWVDLFQTNWKELLQIYCRWAPFSLVAIGTPKNIVTAAWSLVLQSVPELFSSYSNATADVWASCGNTDSYGLRLHYRYCAAFGGYWEGIPILSVRIQRSLALILM